MHVEQAGRQLPLPGADRVAVLADQHDVVDAVDLAQRDDDDGAGMVEVLAGDLTVLAEVDDVAAQVEDAALDDDLGRPDRSVRPPRTRGPRRTRPGGPPSGHVWAETGSAVA